MKRWPHAPSHLVTHPGAYIVTASTYGKARLFDTPEKLSFLEDALLGALAEAGWEVQAWAVFANHYHWVGHSPDSDGAVMPMVHRLHTATGRWLNQQDGAEGRRVWYQAWDTRLTYANSYLARLAYVHQNPVRHGLVRAAEMYPWCSAEWFSQRADRAWRETVLSFPIDRVNVRDDF